MNNKKLNINELYKNFSCYLCGGKYPKTELNVEGFIHHNEKPRCVDTKKCKKLRKKYKKDK